MRILNLYAGIGGNRKLWAQEHEITSVEINPEVAAVYAKYFPNDNLIIGDAHEFLLNNYEKYDFVWSSPPCQSHSKMARVNHKRYDLRQYPDMKLYQEIIFLEEFFEGKWVIENVKPYYDILKPAREIERHYFWSNFRIDTSFRLPKIENFIDAKFDDVREWLGYFDDFNERIYLNGTHDYTQILRNCVHPQLGLHILNCAEGIIRKQSKQMSFL